MKCFHVGTRLKLSRSYPLRQREIKSAIIDDTTKGGLTIFCKLFTVIPKHFGVQKQKLENLHH